MADSSGRAPMVEVGNSETSGRVLEPTSETPVTALLAEGSIADTPDNRAVLAVCERYRRAVEDKDIDLLLELAAPSYLDDGGTPDPSDDVDRTALVDSLRRTFRASYKVQYAFRYQSITWEGDVARVDYRYTASFRHRDRLQQLGDTNQLVLVRSGDTFLLLSGM